MGTSVNIVAFKAGNKGHTYYKIPPLGNGFPQQGSANNPRKNMG